MCGRETHTRPQGRDLSEELLNYGRVKLILKPLYPDVYTKSIERTFDLCEECRDVIESFIYCFASTKQSIEKKHLTVEEVLKEIRKGQKSTNLPFLEFSSRLGNINIMALKIYQFYRQTRKAQITFK